MNSLGFEVRTQKVKGHGHGHTKCSQKRQVAYIVSFFLVSMRLCLTLHKISIFDPSFSGLSVLNSAKFGKDRAITGALYKCDQFQLTSLFTIYCRVRVTLIILA